MAITLQELLVKVGMDISDYSAGIDEAIKKAAEATGSLNSIGVGLSASLTVPLSAIGAAAMEASGEVKAGFKEIIIGTGEVGATLNGLKDSFKNVFAGVPEGAKEVGAAIADLHRRLDLTGAPLEALATQFLNLSHITGQSVEPLIQSTTRAFQAFKISTDQQAGSLDYLFEVFRKTGAPVQQLSDELTQFGPILRSMGLDFQSSAALLGQFEKAGVPATAAMTGLRKALSEMAKAGIDTSHGFQDVVGWIKEASTEAEGLQRSIEIFGSKGGASMFDAIKNGAVDIQNLAKAYKETAGAINETAETTKTQGTRLAEAWHQVQLAIAPVGDVLKGFMSSTIEGMTPLIAAVGDLGKGFASLSKEQKTTVVDLGLIVAAAGPAVIAFEKLAGSTMVAGIVNLASGVSGLGFAFSSAEGPMTAATAELMAFLGVAGGVSVAIGGIGVLLLAQYALIKGMRSEDPTISGLASGVNVAASLFGGGVNMGGGSQSAKSPSGEKMGPKPAPETSPEEEDAQRLAANRLAAAKSAAAAEQALQEAWSAFGQQDLTAQAKKLEAEYDILARSGKATTAQLAADWEKVEAAIDAATRSASGFAMGPPKAFDESKLPSLESLIATGAATLVARDNFHSLQTAIADAKKELAAMIEEENAFRQAGFDPSKIKAGLIDGNESVGAFASDTTTIKQMQNLQAAAEELDKQFANMSNPFGSINKDAEKFIEGLEHGVNAMKEMELGVKELSDARHVLGIRDKEDLEKVQKAYESERKAFEENKIGAAEFQHAQLAYYESLYNEKQKSLEQDIKLKQMRGESANAEVIELANLKARNEALREQATLFGDLYKSIGGDLNKAWSDLGKGIADAIVDGKNFGDVMHSVLKSLEKQIMEDLVGSAFKALKNAFIGLVTGGSGSSGGGGLLGGIISGIGSLFGKKKSGSGLVGDGPIDGGIAGGLDAALGIGSKVANTASSAASEAGGDAMGGMSGSLNALTSIASGIISGMQQAHMESDLQKIEESTRYLKIGLVTQGDSLLNDSHEIRNKLSDFFSGGVGFSTLIDLVKELTDTKDVSAQIRDVLANPIVPLLQQMAAGGVQVVTDDKGNVLVPTEIFDTLNQTIKDGDASIVTGIKEGIQRLVDLADITGQKSAEPPIAQVAPLEPAPAETAPATAPYDNSIHYDTPQVVQTTIPANQNVVQTLLTVNQSIVQGCASIVDQLKGMGGIGGAAATGSGAVPADGSTDSPATTGDIQDSTKRMLDGSVANTEAVVSQVSNVASTVENVFDGPRSFGGAFTDLLQQVVTNTDHGNVSQVFDGPRSFGGAFTDLMQQVVTTPDPTNGGSTAGVFGGPRTFGSDFTNVLNPSASAYTIPIPELNGNWNPVTYVPNGMQSGTTVNIVNPVFRSPQDAQAIVQLVQNSL